MRSRWAQRFGTDAISEAAGEYQTGFDFVKPFATAKNVKARFYVLERTERRLGRMDPSTVPILALPGAPVEIVVKEPRRRREGAAGEGPAPGDAIDDGDAAEAGGDGAGSDAEPADEPDDPAGGDGFDLEGGLLAVAEELAEFVEGGGFHDPPDDGGEAVGEAGVEAAADEDEPPPLPPPPPAPAAEPRRARGAATATVRLPGGTISYYAGYNRFQATCSQGGHGYNACKLTSVGGGDGKPRDTGRPIGMLAAWLSHECADVTEHRGVEAILQPLEARQRARAMVAVSPGDVAELFRGERLQGPGEEEEPVDITPYVRRRL